jgi:hypothetical protein
MQAVNWLLLAKVKFITMRLLADLQVCRRGLHLLARRYYFRLIQRVAMEWLSDCVASISVHFQGFKCRLWCCLFKRMTVVDVL